MSERSGGRVGDGDGYRKGRVSEGSGVGKIGCRMGRMSEMAVDVGPGD